MLWPYVASCVLFVAMLCYMLLVSRIPTAAVVIFDAAALLWLLALAGIVLWGW